MLPVRGDEREDRSPDDLVRRVTEEALGGRVPTGDGAVEVFCDDRIIGRFDDGREAPARFFAATSIGNVTEGGGERRLVAGGESSDRQLDQAQRAVRPERRDFQAVPKPGAFPGLE